MHKCLLYKTDLDWFNYSCPIVDESVRFSDSPFDRFGGWYNWGTYFLIGDSLTSAAVISGLRSPSGQLTHLLTSLFHCFLFYHSYSMVKRVELKLCLVLQMAGIYNLLVCLGAWELICKWVCLGKLVREWAVLCFWSNTSLHAMCRFYE